MFKSSENLRLAAEMRALQRVAAPWRESRATWFDGTPDSIAARIAATDRVLTVARAGYTQAHIALEREAAVARAELTAAQHRLMTDFLDDGARVAGKHDADPERPWKNRDTGEDTPTDHWENLHLSPFDDVDDYEGKHRKSSLRVTASQDEMVDCRECGRASDYAEVSANQGHCPICDDYNHDLDLARHYGSLRRTADESTGFAWQSDNPLDDDDPYWQDEGFRSDVDDLHALEHRLRPGFDDDDPARYSALKVAAIEFVAAQNTADRGELMFRAHRHASDRTGQLPREQARRVVKAFVAAVADQAPRPRRTRTAAAPATLPDFDDQLLFDNS